MITPHVDQIIAELWEPSLNVSITLSLLNICNCPSLVLYTPQLCKYEFILHAYIIFIYVKMLICKLVHNIGTIVSMLFRFMQKWGLSSSHAYCIFLKSTNRNVQNVLFLKSWIGNWTKPLLLAGCAKIQYIRDDERPHFHINLNKNIDSKVYCNANQFPNHLLY
jgi:hypothetical protein